MHKKLLSIVLSVLVVLASFVAVLTFSAFAASVNLVDDGSFEDNTFDWQTHNNTGNSSAAFAFAATQSGNCITAPAGLSMFKQVTLEKDVEYTISFDFKLDSNTVPSTYTSFYRAGFVNAVGAISGSNFVGPNTNYSNKYYQIYSQQKAAATSWVNHKFTFKPTENMTTWFVIGSYDGNCVSGFSVDNVYIAKTSDLIPCTVIAGSGGTAGGTTASYQGGTITVRATPDAGNTFDGWYNASETKVSDQEVYTFKISEPISLTAKFKAGTYQLLIPGGDFATGSLNGFEIFKNGTSESFTPVANGDSDYYIQGVAGLSLYRKVDLKSGTAYTFSFDFKFLSDTVPTTYNSFYRAGFVTAASALSGSNFVGPSTSANKYYNIYSGQTPAKRTEWVTHTLTFTPAQDMTVYAVVGSYNQQAVAEFAFDNLKLYKSSDLVTITPVATDGGTVSGKLTKLPGETATVVATPSAEDTFVGWFDGDTAVSTEATYSFKATASVTLTAKFEAKNLDGNLLKNGKFEQSFTATTLTNVGFDPANLSSVAGKWGRIFSGVTRMDLVSSDKFAAEDSAALNGTAYMTSGATKDANQFIRGFGQYVYLPKGDYTLSFISKSDSGVYFTAAVLSKPDVVTGASFVAKTTIAQSEQWKQNIMNFNVDAAGYYQVSFGGNTQKQGDIAFSVDNVYLSLSANYIAVTAETDGGGTVTHPMGNQTTGSPATVTAKADPGFTFTGWYDGTKLISTDANYTFTIIGSVTLKAVFEKESASSIINGDFETGTTAGWTVKKTSGKGKNYSVIVDPDTGSKVAASSGVALAMYQKISLQAGVEYIVSFNFKFDDNAEVPSTYDSFYRSGFVNEMNNLNNASFVGPGKTQYKYYSIFYKQSQDKLTEWKCHSYTFTPDANFNGYFVIGAVNENGCAEYFVDNIVIKRIDECVTLQTAAVSHGGSGTVTCDKGGILSQNELFTVTATANAGSKFAGWYNNGVLVSENESFTQPITQSMVLYARFVDAVRPESKQFLDNYDFSTGDLSGWSGNNTSSATSKAEYVRENGESFVRLHSNDMLYQTIEMEPGATYYIKIVTRIPKIMDVTHDKNFYRAGFSVLDNPTVLQSATLIPETATHVYLVTVDTKKQYTSTSDWMEYTYTYSNLSDKTILTNAVVGTPYCTEDLEIKSFACYQYANGVINFSPENKYGEEFYNYVSNGTFESALTNDNWGVALPAGWELRSGHKETGNRYLSVAGGASKLIAVPVQVGYSYTVGFSLRTAAAGTASVAIVDKNGNPLPDAFSLSDKTALYKPSANNTWQRLGAEVYITGENNNKWLFLKITSGNNRMDIDDVTVVRATHGYAEDPNFYGDLSYNYDTTKVYNPTLFYGLEDSGTGIEGIGSAEPGANAATGETATVYFVLSGLMLALAALIIFFKRRESITAVAGKGGSNNE